MRRFIFFFAAFLGAALHPALAETIHLRVLDSQDSLIPNARLEVREGHASAGVFATTASDGTATLELILPACILVRAEGFESLSRKITENTANILILHLRPAMVRSSIDVVVRDDSAPLDLVSTALEIDRTGARTVFDAVDRVVPGAFVTRRGVMGYGISTNGTGGVSMRGVGESPNTGVLIIVDGRPDFQGLMGHPLPDFYSLSDAGTVSVTEGPASVLYGSNAMGGVIEIKNWAPPEGTSTRLTTSFGSFYTGQHRLAHGARFRRGFYSVNDGLSHTSGDRPSSAFRNQDGTVTAGYELSSTWKAAVEGRYGHFHVEDPGPLNAPLANNYARVGRGGFSVNLDNATSRTWGYLRAYSSYGNHYITDGFRSTDRTTGVRVDQTVALSPHLTVQLGSDVVNFGGQARNVTGKLDYGSHQLNTAAGFSRAQWSVTHRLNLHAGLRYESNSAFGGIAVPEAGATIKLANGYSLSGAVGRGFRNPTIRELYLFPAPNPSLMPEHLWNYQATLQARPLTPLSLSFTGYYTDLSNLVVVTGRYPNLVLQNSGAALNRGVEATARWRAHKRLNLQSGYALVHSTNLTPYIPAQKFNYGVEFDAGRAFIYFGGMCVGSRWANTQHSAELDPYTLGMLKLSIPLRRAWTLFTMVDNVFNRSYQVVPGYPMPGTNAAGGLTLSF